MTGAPSPASAGSTLSSTSRHHSSRVKIPSASAHLGHGFSARERGARCHDPIRVAGRMVAEHDSDLVALANVPATTGAAFEVPECVSVPAAVCPPVDG